MMKEYLKKQLKYWVENFTEDMLPRDLASKTFTRQQITLSKIDLKTAKVAVLLQIPPPLLVTRAHCSEITIKVPSWTQAEKFVQEPLHFRVSELSLELRNASECDENVRAMAATKMQAAIMEPDPLGSIASWYAFSTILSERFELVVDKVSVKLFAQHKLRATLELTKFHARTTNALWQDMRDLTSCVDRSPDGLLKTRFKFVSFQSTLQVHNDTATPIALLQDHAVAMRITSFGHRKSKAESWETLSQVIDVNLETVAVEYQIAQLLYIQQLVALVLSWIADAKVRDAAASARGAGIGSPILHHHQVQRGAVRKHQQEKDVDSSDPAGFALQLTFRFTLHGTISFTSERKGLQKLTLNAYHVATNLIVHHDGVRELQLTFDRVDVMHKDAMVLYIKPDRAVFQYKQLTDTVFIQWRLQKVACTIEGDLALVLNEAYHAANEKEQSASINCGTCHRRVLLDQIESHVCEPLSPASAAKAKAPDRKSTVTEPSDAERKSTATASSSTTIPKLRLVFTLDELELKCDSHLFHNVQQHMALARTKAPVVVQRKLSCQATNLSITTEAKEFVGDSIFVPVLPLAFQILECTVHGCDCLHNAKSKQRTSSARTGSSQFAHVFGSSTALPRWPDRIYVELEYLDARAVEVATSREACFTAEGLKACSSFSDGVLVCRAAHPQMSVYVDVQRIRCQLDHTAFRFLERWHQMLAAPFEAQSKQAQTLFLAVLDIATVEFTLGQQASDKPRFKLQLRQLGLVADNQMGHLAIQTTLDLKSLLNAQAAAYAFTDEEESAGVEVGDVDAASMQTDDRPKSIAERLRLRKQRQDHERLEAATKLQAFFRRRKIGHVKRTSARIPVAEEPVPAVVEEPVMDEEPVDSSPGQRGKAASVPAVSARFGSADDMLHAAKVASGVIALGTGFKKFVVNTKTQLGSEMTELAAHSKESAARMVLPHYSACKKMLNTMVSTSEPDLKTMELRKAEAEHSSTTCLDEDDVDIDELREREQELERQQQSDVEGRNKRKPVLEYSDSVVTDQEGDDDANAEQPSQLLAEEEHGLDPALLAALPPLVRVLIQIEEHRMCVPINPREKIGVLCHQIVRRFNELFAHGNAAISHVSLQDQHGGVFAASDIVGFVHKSEDELLFARAHREGDSIRSQTRLDAATLSSGSGSKRKQLGRKFARCSKLPLPLVISLLANESERDLLNYVVQDGSYGGGKAEEWPELALNVSFLDPAHMLEVEVCWHGKCLEVTNIDAFVLCLQQLGLCTGRPTSKFIGKVLRDRLKMDAKNPLVAAAARVEQLPLRSTADAPDDPVAPVSEDADANTITYNSLKELVQETYGVYMHTSA
ncbi:TPA: hypothetical protein N0F65_004060 [Lagenidium giganteum]|uniref:Chorein N-terminal domain-containing protein n=1 Tax=Lagenidium giganteum TaxID=4803 RepID=A0AAV2YWG6_9STRA|nr:TPA: hypothetical protein N0F65_004060 [Lagenidium giganteum]